MEKLIYKNEEQLINDAVKMLIKKHLAWRCSDEKMPSRDLDNVRGNFYMAYIGGCYTVDEWDSMNEYEQDKCFAYCDRKFDKAAAEADRKWEAVKVMLDL